MRDGRQGGMTLIEILVAMSLLAILSVLGYKAFGSLLISRERLMQTSEQWVDAARAFRRLEGDLTGQMPAPTQGQGPSLGGSQLLLQSDGDGQTLTPCRVFPPAIPAGRSASATMPARKASAGRRATLRARRRPPTCFWARTPRCDGA
ncbi:prepilin-type N-terminal cleavage/methylation domain-containing protein [Chromobacterium haemolyticum]|nr:prepilin-type N-terminal cleavage/methylation domain-containing protein [Chromobacterium haemolyticum]